METNSLQFWLVLIPVITTSIVGIITALKVRQVHTLVNSAMTQEKAENTLLRGMLVTKQLEIDTAERVRSALATATAATPIQVTAETPLAVRVVEESRFGKPS